ncbi:Serine phosphatase RsbU, regulator of sigma subunit [Marivirga sericea]|uniref:Serine phosphatase RsbU, regulator of sigma subunit n=1 Tax=Marivirga sericea TaxID=1028 RepID=A0A1X7KI47_9BACT|nr:tetratricopeptide repeat protein [Marivirga sericea]SMG40623.1 Serine phosphatase RsbU, regulator of sigma subunit [Marivirga sericea]
MNITFSNIYSILARYRFSMIAKKSFFLVLIVVFTVAFDSFSQRKGDTIDSTEVMRLNALFRIQYKSQPAKSFEYANTALEISKRINFLQGEATANNNLGVYYKQKGDYDKALNYYKISFNLYDSLRNQEGIGKSLSNIGNIYSINEDFERALDYYTDAKEIFEKLKDVPRLLRILNNIGNIYLDQGQEFEAEDYYRRVLRIYEQNPSQSSLFDPYSNIGKIYFNRQAYDSALYYFNKSLKKEEAADNKFGVSAALVKIARLHNARGSHMAAKNAALDAVDIANSINAKPILLDAFSTLAEVYIHLEDLKNSYMYMNQYHIMNDSLFNEKSRRAIAELEKSIELEQKEKEIALLRKESEIKDLQYQNSQLFTYGAFGFSILLLSLAIISFQKFKQNRKAKTLLEYQNEEILKSKQAIEIQKMKLESWNQNITDSIEYAKSIQDGIMNKNSFKENIPSSFVYYKPKDIVSGDFYWYSRQNGCDILALIDCTGHGVAGAFMTVIANATMNQIVNEEHEIEPHKILAKLDIKVMDILKQKEVTRSNHSMDVALCKIDYERQLVTFSGAKRPLYVVEDNELKEFKGNNFTVGEYFNSPDKKFTFQEIEFEKNQTFYLSSDGFPDQFGIKTQKKYLRKRFKSLLESISNKSLPEQGKSLELEMKRWQGEMQQTDDMLVIGFRV